MQIFLVRHGSTDHNREQRFQGRQPISLNAKGWIEARALATYLGTTGLKFAGIYSSDLARAVETAMIIADVLGAPVVTDPRFQEMSCGIWEGMLVSTVAKDYPDLFVKWQRDAVTNKPPEGESLTDVLHRVSMAYEEIHARHVGNNVIIVSHGAAIVALLSYVHGWSVVDAWNDHRARHVNAALTHLKIDDRTGRLIYSAIASTDHLL